MHNNKLIALITDFGSRGHFVGTMKGVILKIDASIRIFDISHDIEPQNILETAYTLADTLQYWPEGTTFAVVVDPGVGTARKSLAAKTRSNHIILCPDNGILTEVTSDPGLVEVRVLSESIHRLPGSGKFHTFHGRDIYAYTAGRLASGIIGFDEVGHVVDDDITRLPVPDATAKYDMIEGVIVKVEYPFGNICTNIPGSLIEEVELTEGELVRFEIFESGGLIHSGKIPFVKTFGAVSRKSPLAYVDSSDRLGLAVNMGNFSQEFKIKAGLTWRIRLFFKNR